MPVNTGTSEDLAENRTFTLGIICLTQDNQHSPWILFEAGALSKNLEESKVCPVLFNFDTTDLTGPLSSFQATKFGKDDIKKLLESINNSCNESKLDQKSLDETFDMWWPKLDEKIKEILAQDKSNPKSKKRAERDILEEILELTRSNAKSILSDQRSVSHMTVDELWLNYRRIKEKIQQGGNVEIPLAQMESSIIRLCKECDYEDVYMRHRGIRTFSVGGEIYREKNSSRDSGVSLMKRGSEEGTESRFYKDIK